MKNGKPLFEEKQYIGLNKASLMMRMVLAVFCFAVYYWNEKQGKDIEILFITGVAIILISLALLFFVHLKTRIYSDKLVLSGSWTSCRIDILINDIVEVDLVPYSKYIFDTPVYNLHRNDTIHFFTGGNQAMKLRLNNDLTYIIGTQNPAMFQRTLRGLLTPVH
jgi:heme/copper-type cytochrome/quinol oxidase subunit 4